jgi:hypothetical protein
MKEKFLNIILFLLSLCFLAGGVVLMFFNNMTQVSILYKNIYPFFSSEKIATFFISFFGTFIFGWGILLFLLIIFAVMDLKRNYLHGFIFWAFTFWAASAGAISFLHKFNFLLIIISIIYGVLFLVFFLSIPMKSGSQKQTEPKI